MENVGKALANLLDPAEAKSYAEKYITEPSGEWMKTNRFQTMNELLETKAVTNTAFASQLRASMGQPLLHTVSDPTWGIGLNTQQAERRREKGSLGVVTNGENKLGVLLEQLRSSMMPKLDQQ